MPALAIRQLNENCELDNLLVKQKNELIDRINAADTLEKKACTAELDKVFFALNILRPLWKTVNYEYKYFEVYNRALKVLEKFSS